MIQKGRVCRPSSEGPVVATMRNGEPFDLFEVTDRLSASYRMIYVVDLDGIEHNDPQLDYLQEIARESAIWIDAGVRTADQGIDILVTGARRAVLSTAYLASPGELAQAWKLSTDLAFEIETRDGRVVAADPGWTDADPVAIATEVRKIGMDSFVYSPRRSGPDWRIVQELATHGPLWVGGTFERDDVGRLASAGATAGIFQIDRELAAWEDSKP
jgi:phosphoribosylformimino-5-aminoimidazole carboxamide ribonucleotide (ProFAR) isomerase